MKERSHVTFLKGQKFKSNKPTPIIQQNQQL